MSTDDSQEKKPLKLKLSRDVGNEAQPEKIEDAPQPDAPKAVEPTVEKPVSNPPKTSRPPIVQHKEEVVAAEPEIAPEEDAKSFSPPPPVTPDLEDTISSIDSKEPAAPAESSLLPSIIVLLILFLILAGAGYGLWRILQEPEKTQQKEELIASDSPSAPSKSPIDRAEETISKVPVADVDAIADLAPTTAEASPNGEKTSVTSAEPKETLSKKASSSFEANKQKVSQFLAQIHIGGVRKGDRPMVMIKGKGYLVGDTVQSETGLKFYGIRDGRLAFQDENGIVYLKSF